MADQHDFQKTDDTELGPLGRKITLTSTSASFSSGVASFSSTAFSGVSS